MILAFGKDGDIHVKWLREKLNRPVMTADKAEGIRNLLPIATIVFIKASTYAWKTYLDLPEHGNVFMVGQTDESGAAQHCMRNFREANIRDVFLVGDPDDEARLIARFEEQVIEEVPDEESVRGKRGRSNGRMDGRRIEAVPAQPF